MRKVKHWLHILLTILTSGLWLPVYVILLATTEMFNRGYREGKAAGRVARQNEIDEEEDWRLTPEEKAAKVARIKQSIAERRAGSYMDDHGRRVIHDGNGDVRFGCTAAPIAEWMEYGALKREPVNAPSEFDRFKELGDRMLSGQPLDQYEQLEYNELRAKVINP